MKSCIAKTFFCKIDFFYQKMAGPESLCFSSLGLEAVKRLFQNRFVLHFFEACPAVS